MVLVDMYIIYLKVSKKMKLIHFLKIFAFTAIICLTFYMYLFHRCDLVTTSSILHDNNLIQVKTSKVEIDKDPTPSFVKVNDELWTYSAFYYGLVFIHRR